MEAASVEAEPGWRAVFGGGAVSLGWSLIVMAPVVFTNRSFGADWWLHLELVREAQMGLSAGLLPPAVMSFSPVGVFAPIPYVYGGTLYTLGGGLALLGLGPERAYSVLHVLIAWAAVFGTWWIGYQLLRRFWISFLPAVVLSTSAWFLGDALGRGGFAEFAATMVLPLALAGAVHIWRWNRPTIGGVLALGGGTIVATGSHNGSLVWTLIVVMLSLLTAAAIWRGGALRGHAAAVRAVAVTAVGAALVNGWFLVGDAALASRVEIARRARFQSDWSSWFGNPRVWLSPVRYLPSQHVEFFRAAVGSGTFKGATSLYVQFPIVAAFWMLAATLLLRRRRDLLTVALPFLVPLALLSLLIMVPETWRALPNRLGALTQFSMRLNSWVILLVAALVLLVLRALTSAGGRSGSTWAIALLVLVAALGAVQTVHQGWTTSSVNVLVDRLLYNAPRGTALQDPYTAPGWYEPSFPRAMDGAPFIPLDSVHSSLQFDYRDAQDGAASASSTVAPGTLLVTNVVSPTELIRVRGARVVGRTTEGFLVFQKTTSEPRVAVRVKWPWYRSVGLAVTAVGLALVGSQLFHAARWRSRGRRRAAGSPTPRRR